jgi:DNA invertase Pin-like site-specific DNA recombinase
MKSQPTKPSLRCAIYTRVSTDQKLEQEFNSLDAQREASEAYIKSQTHEGWSPVRSRFDDGGFSGGSMERPALRRLLSEVQAKRIDVIIVYKVDRLTRSLADFAKLVELFDAHSVSFVSVTQSFNTTTSMGRLTLNVLLSFAQFEREVTGERIRDKIAASKKKGMWMGGVVPLGYRVDSRALHIVEDHAELVRALFRRYLEAGSVARLKQIIDAEDLRLPIRVDGVGRSTGGGLFSRGHVYKIFSNPIYIGQIAHKGQVHAGQHRPIVDRDLWDGVQRSLRDHLATGKERHERQSTNAMLIGKLFDDRGNLMTPSWSKKGSKRWRYYVSQAVLRGDNTEAGSVARVSAPEIENKIIEAVGNLAQRKGSEARPPGYEATAGDTPSREAGNAVSDRHVEIRSLIDRVTLERTTIRIALSPDLEEYEEAKVLTIPWTPPSPYRRREIIQGANVESAIARPMRQSARLLVIDALRKAHRWLDELLADPRQTVEAIASREGKSERSIRMMLSLAFLAPDIVKAAVEGCLPRGFGLTRLIDLPIAWSDQWEALGLKAPARA